MSEFEPEPDYEQESPQILPEESVMEPDVAPGYPYDPELSEAAPQPAARNSRPIDAERAGELARQAMERARTSARLRGARIQGARPARKDQKKRARDSQPFGAGRDPETAAASVAAFLESMGWKENIEIASVTSRWRDIMGDTIADHCNPDGFSDGHLQLKATSTAWALEIKRLSGNIRHNLNEALGREVVREISVVGPSAPSWKKGPRSVKGRGPRDTYG